MSQTALLTGMLSVTRDQGKHAGSQLQVLLQLDDHGICNA